MHVGGMEDGGRGGKERGGREGGEKGWREGRKEGGRACLPACIRACEGMCMCGGRKEGRGFILEGCDDLDQTLRHMHAPFILCAYFNGTSRYFPLRVGLHEASVRWAKKHFCHIEPFLLACTCYHRTGVVFPLSDPVTACLLPTSVEE